MDDTARPAEPQGAGESQSETQKAAVEREPCPWRLGIIVSYLGSVAIFLVFWASRVVERHVQLDMVSVNKVRSSLISVR